MLDNIEYTIHRPILSSIINDLKESIFKNKDIYTEYLDNYEDSDFDSSKNIFNNTVKNESLEITSEITSNDDLALTNNVLRNNHKNLLRDTSIIFNVSPNTINTKFSITLKYYNNSKNTILKLINKLKLTTINNSYYDQHMVEYYYNIPVNLLALIKNINILKNGVDTSYYTYMNSITTTSIDYVNSRTKDYSVPTIRERQPVIGNFETDLFNINKLDKDEKGWYVELEYLVVLDVPTNLMVEYPILVNNIQIDTDFIPQEAEQEVELLYGASDIIDSLARISGTYFTDSITNNTAIINYPRQDTFKPSISTKPDMLRLMSIMTQISATDLNTLINLNDFDSLIINKDIITYLKTRIGNTLFQPYEDIFHFELYENDMLVDKNLYVDNLFNIRTDTDLNIGKTYRLILNCMYNLNSFPYTDRIDTTSITDYFSILNKINVRGVYINNPSIYTVLITEIFAIKK